MPGRLATITFWRYEGWKLAAALFVAGLFVVGGVTLREHDTQQLDREICARVDNVNNVIVALLARSQNFLPANGYYRAHPSELAAAQRENRRAIREFKSAAC